ncbi:hypothetical protein MAPG_09036 [Magnaporthiopsis poae ATCC 64411]|uniref:Uncharacterized protein n=1 Tax=Magnaporthiopsis poae (strain ATCC 64411 / 73-15) TaxID=644358 RepID=A0A0C4E8W6_MAGP6|nr:hypothetical protein MAPG_09036 [Magnaporthiopsis poae ATCC 64411]
MAPEHTVERLLALDDPALVEFMKSHWDAQEALDVTDISDWDEAPKPEQTKLVERFMHLAPQARKPQLLDFGQLAARLDALSRPEAEASSRNAERPWLPHERPRTESPEEDMEKHHQTRCYDALIADGGRPPFPLELLDEMEARPRDFVEAVEPWMGKQLKLLFFSLTDLGVFQRPLDRWKEFRKWQRDNRGVEVSDEEDLALYRQESLDRDALWGQGLGMPLERYNATVEGLYDLDRDSRRRDRETHREVLGGTFDQYLEAARRRLRDNGFDEELQLLEDPKQQGERVTWLEYLGFEYWWLERLTRAARQWEEKRVSIWENLVSSGLLKDGETQEDVLKAKPKGEGGPSEGGSSQTDPRDKLVRRLTRATNMWQYSETRRSRQQRLVEWARGQLSEIVEPEANPKKKPKGNAKKRRRQPVDAAEGPTSRRPAAKKRKQGENEDASGAAARRKPVPRKKRMVVELESSVPLTDTRVPNSDGLRRSARIKGLEKEAKGGRGVLQ